MFITGDFWRPLQEDFCFFYLLCLTHHFPSLSPSSEGAAMASGSSEVTATQEPAEAAEECSGKETPKTAWKTEDLLQMSEPSSDKDKMVSEQLIGHFSIIWLLVSATINRWRFSSYVLLMKDHSRKKIIIILLVQANSRLFDIQQLNVCKWNSLLLPSGQQNR